MPVPPPKRHRWPPANFMDEHPYVIKLDIKISKLKQQISAIYNLANCDLILSDARTGVHNFCVSEQFTKKLEDVSKNLASLSKQVANNATEIHDKINRAVENKAQLQNTIYVGEVYSKQCDVIKKHDRRTKHFKSLTEFRIKHELIDSSTEEEGDDDTQPASKKHKTTNELFSGKSDGHFQYVKQNKNNPAAHNFICDMCEAIFRDTKALRNHEATYSMEFYHCMQCLKVF